jgi:hypothetical protein
MTTVQRLPLTISEADFQRTVIQTAMVYGWRVSHQRPAQVRTGRWATAITGHPGLPDLVLARDGVVLLFRSARLREQIAAEIEAAEVAGLEPGPGGLGPAARWGLGLAARIARGKS